MKLKDSLILDTARVRVLIIWKYCLYYWCVSFIYIILFRRSCQMPMKVFTSLIFNVFCSNSSVSMDN